MWGADADDLDATARRLGDASRQLDQIARRLGAALAQAPWEGPAADRFRHDWNRVHRARIVGAGAYLRDGERALHRNAAAQREASAPGSGVGGPGTASLASLGAVLARVLGPDWQSRLSDPLTPDDVARLLSAVSRIEQWLEHPSLEAGMGGGRTVSGEADWDGATSIGDVDLSAWARASFEAGVEGHARATLSPSELSVLAGVSAGVMATAGAGGALGYGPAKATAKVEATAQARAYAEAQARLTKDGLKASAEAGAIVGVSASAQADVDVAGVGAGGKVSGYAGAGVMAKADAEVTLQRVQASVKLGAAVGLGASVEFKVSVEPAKVAHELGGAGRAATSFFAKML
jgi:uncharacterized protein YukE